MMKSDKHILNQDISLRRSAQKADTKVCCDGSLRSFFFFLFLSMTMLFLVGCGGGGQSSEPAVTLISYEAEYQAQPGLSSVSAAPAYDKGYSGDAIRIGIVDSGLDSTHPEFTGKSFSGGDWQGNTGGLADPHGHGSHVGGIAGGQRNGQGMHGIAPASHLYGYRILNRYGYFGGRTGAEMIPSVVTHAIDNDVRILNNSWASSTEINDVSKDVIISALGDELDSWIDAVDAGHVMVWAAGNDRDSQVSVRSGLPFHFSGLQPGWLAVVSSGLNGKEPVYTNRCGVAQSWCLAAPGGDDKSQTLGILSAQSGGGYVRKSGTSMAAPHVAGGLALIMEAFPELSAQDAAARILETADYEGLVTADGCTIDSCTEANMRAVFGRGQMNISAALQPVSPLYLSSGRAEFALSHSRLMASELLYGPLRSALEGHTLIAKDEFDGARFSVAAHMLIQPQPNMNPLNKFLASTQPSHTTTHPVYQSDIISVSLTANESAPIHPDVSHKLVDISALPQSLWLIADTNQTGGYGSEWRMRVGVDEERQSLSMQQTQLISPPHTDIRARGLTRLWYGAGIARHSRLADSTGFGGLSPAMSSERWIFGGLSSQYRDITAAAEMLMGTIQSDNSEGLLHATDLTVSSARLSLEHKPTTNIHSKLSLVQPLMIEQGQISISDGFAARPLAVSFGSSSRPVYVQLSGKLELTPSLFLSTGLHFRGFGRNDQARPARMGEHIYLTFSARL